jgi:peroxiredoxin
MMILTPQDYRGFWCPFCIAHLKELAALSSDIKAAGGTLLAVTADPPENLEKTRSSTGFSDTVIVDPENILAKELKNRGTLDVAISTNGAAWLRGYKHGMAQPALLVMKNDGTVLQRWAIVPSLVSSDRLCRTTWPRKTEMNR